MGSVYITNNGGENSKVQARQIFHAVVSGESRLVNEQDVKLATRKSLHLANSFKAKNIVMLPADCGTHDISDTARVQLAAIKTFLKTNKNSEIKNIYIVMDDEESYKTYQEYYSRIFV
jgi:O-acetyl-ADP-ribose deacetylase (regulator of RNase III)